MNVEELAEFADLLWLGLEEHGAAPRLRELQEALARQVGQPAETTYQTQVSDAFRALQESLITSPLYQFTPRWREMADQLGLKFILPDELFATIEEIFARNQITVSVAYDEIAQLSNRVTEAAANLLKMNEAFRHFHINSYALASDDFEIAVTIPRREVSNNLRELGEEFVELEKLILPFVEISDGSRPQLEVRAIASSDFEAIVQLAPQAAMLLSIAIDRVLMIYDRVLDIRLKRKQLKDSGLSDATLQAIDEDANQLFMNEVPTVVREIMDAAGQDQNDGRYFELETELTKSVKKIGRRIDHGFKLTVRTGPSDLAADETSTDGELSAREVVLSNQVRATTRALDGDPILQLEPATEDQAPASSDPQPEESTG